MRGWVGESPHAALWHGGGPPTWVSGGRSWAVGVSTACRRAACPRGAGGGSGGRWRVVGGRWRGSTGRGAPPTEASGGCHHQRCDGTRAGARKRGAPRGACAERAGVRSGVGENRQQGGEVLWRHVARPPPPLPCSSSIGPPPNAQWATRWRRWFRSNTPPRRRATDSSDRLRLRADEGGEEPVRTGGCTSSENAERAPAGARGCGTLGQGRSRGARGACRRRAARWGGGQARRRLRGKCRERLGGWGEGAVRRWEGVSPHAASWHVGGHRRGSAGGAPAV